MTRLRVIVGLLLSLDVQNMYGILTLPGSETL
jgi:hypothetical protein